MLSRSQAKVFFLGGTALTTITFVWLTVDSFQKFPSATHAQNLDPQVVAGKHLWDSSNCMGCHTLLGEGGYYAPELTKVYERRGAPFITAMLKDPEALYPGQRKMYKYAFTDAQIASLIAFLKWIGEMDLNGYPPRPFLFPVATVGSKTLVETSNRPKAFNQLCIACHALEGQGGAVGPPLDGVGDRMTKHDIEVWLDNPGKVKPGTAMPDLPLTEADILELSAFLSTLKRDQGQVP